MRVLHYYNRNGELRSVEFVQVIKQWIEINGGISNFNNEISRMNNIEKASIQFAFIKFFIEKYNCSLPEFGSDYFQPEVYEPEIYHEKIYNFLYEHNTRPTSIYNIAFLIIVALALIGLLKLCS